MWLGTESYLHVKTQLDSNMPRYSVHAPKSHLSLKTVLVYINTVEDFVGLSCKQSAKPGSVPDK